MSPDSRQIGSLIRVALPVAVATVMVTLAVANLALVKVWRGEGEDGVLWIAEGANVVALDVAEGSAAQQAGLEPRDVLLRIDDQEITRVADVVAVLHEAGTGQTLTYDVQRASADVPLSLTLLPMPAPRLGLYYSLALVGVLAIVVGTSVRLRRPADPATLHFFWLTVAFFGGFAFTMSGRLDRLDYFFFWADAVAWLLLPPLFLHFALVFPERPNAWLRSDASRAVVPLLYLPAALLGGARVAVIAGGVTRFDSAILLARLELLDLAYLVICLVGGLLIMLRALSRLRSVTARRQLRWIVWGSSVGTIPFIVLYALPFLVGQTWPVTEYTAVLLGCIPLAFASAIVRYRLMDIEVIIKKGLVVAAVGLLLVAVYAATVEVVNLVLDVDQDAGSFWALFATLVVVLVAPWLWNAIQSALDRLYYRDRYDYRRALVNFARELNSDLDLRRLSSRLVERVRETLGLEKFVLYLLADTDRGPRFTALRGGGFEDEQIPPILPGTGLATRLGAGQTVSFDDPVPLRRLASEEATAWREAGLTCFVPCVSKEGTIGVLAAGRRQHGEPLSSEDLTLLGAVASQAATALENARLYGQLQGKADEIERLRQFSDSVVESLSDGLFVVDLEDRVLRWNRRMEALTGYDRGRAVGRRLAALFTGPFVETLEAARRESPAGTSLHRVSLVSGAADPQHPRLVNVAIAPLEAADGAQTGWIVVLEDVTDRAHLEEQLRLSEKMAAIGLLAAGVAHEVNTPLTGISSFTQMLLERSEPGDPRTQLLEKIERQTFRAAKIVNSLLNLARPSGGDTGPVDLNVVINDVLSLLEYQFRISRVQVRKELASPAVVVRGVEYKLQQVFLNLLLNARDAMPKGGWVSVSTRVESGQALVEVGDTGMGIPSEHLARIYDPFFTTKPEGGGTGLGLSVTYGIVQEHGGSLVCESAVGQGTKFRMILPAIEQPLSVAEVP